MIPQSPKKKIVPISEVVLNVFSQIEKTKSISKEAVEASWRELAGDAAFRHSRPMTLRKQVLMVRVDSSAWLQDLTMKKRFLLKGLKRSLGKDKISEIQFKIGEF